MLKTFLKAASYRLFFLLDTLGLHVLPKNYYTPIPDYRWLRENKDVWMGRADISAIGWDPQEQISWLEQTCKSYYPEVAGLSFYEQTVRSNVGPGYGPIESQILHCFIRTFAPARIVEIGSGLSTACMLQASDMNGNEGKLRSQITCIEPHPKEGFSHLQNIIHLQQTCQTVPDEVFKQLQAGDLLFIDSSHAVKVGSDAVKIYLQIIPFLSAGVFVHAHDIFLPYLYDRDALSTYFGWQETSLLLALLSNNNRLKVLSCLSALHYDYPSKLTAFLSDYQPQANQAGLKASNGGHFPSSIWLATQ